MLHTVLQVLAVAGIVVVCLVLAYVMAQGPANVVRGYRPYEPRYRNRRRRE